MLGYTSLPATNSGRPTIFTVARFCVRHTLRPVMALLLITILFLQIAYGSSATPVRRQEVEPTQEAITAVSDCHLHDTSVFCMFGETEYLVKATATATADFPLSFTGCHNHGSNTFCLTPDNEDVEVVLASDVDSHGDGNAEEEESNDTPEERHCHFHAGVEHCVGGSEEQNESETRCEKVDRDYDIPLRIGCLFAILVTSTIGVFGPIFLHVYLPERLNLVIALLRQFGTGVIISTAFVHLFTHATLMFANPCLGELSYEGTPAALLMAGLFVSFLIEYLSHRLAAWYLSRTDSGTKYNRNMISVLVLEAGIIFHSLLKFLPQCLATIIGLTLVVAGDSFFITLFIVIVFHQMFEGIALGSRIASLGTRGPHHNILHHAHTHGITLDPKQQTDQNSDDDSTAPTPPVPLIKKLLMASGFALVTPVGMAIGIGVLQKFNGNDPTTIWAIGTLDAVSAGILVWAGIVEMWAGDWILDGEMAAASPVRTVLGLTFLVLGMMIMSVLGKWA